jgi:hypothetical protein
VWEGEVDEDKVASKSKSKNKSKSKEKKKKKEMKKMKKHNKMIFTSIRTRFEMIIVVFLLHLV